MGSEHRPRSDPCCDSGRILLLSHPQHGDHLWAHVALKWLSHHGWKRTEETKDSSPKAPVLLQAIPVPVPFSTGGTLQTDRNLSSLRPCQRHGVSAALHVPQTPPPITSSGFKHGPHQPGRQRKEGIKTPTTTSFCLPHGRDCRSPKLQAPPRSNYHPAAPYTPTPHSVPQNQVGTKPRWATPAPNGHPRGCQAAEPAGAPLPPHPGF